MTKVGYIIVDSYEEVIEKGMINLPVEPTLRDEIRIKNVTYIVVGRVLEENKPIYYKLRPATYNQGVGEA